METVQAEASQVQAKAKSQAELKKSLFGDDDDDDDGAPLAELRGQHVDGWWCGVRDALTAAGLCTVYMHVVVTVLECITQSHLTRPSSSARCIGASFERL